MRRISYALAALVISCSVTSPVVRAQGVPGMYPQAGASEEWKRVDNGSISISQAYSDNSVPGAGRVLNVQGALAWTSLAVKSDRVWANTLSIQYGQARYEGERARKASDEISFESKYTRHYSDWIHPFAAARFQSQMTPGYDFQDTSVRRISGIFDPSFLAQTVGLGKNWSGIFDDPNSFSGPSMGEFYLGLGGTLKQTFSAARYGYADDPATAEVETFRLEPGTSVAINASYASNQYSKLSSNLDLFTNFKGFEAADVRWTNSLTGVVVRGLNLSLAVSFSMSYDRDISREAQINQSVGLQLPIL